MLAVGHEVRKCSVLPPFQTQTTSPSGKASGRCMQAWNPGASDIPTEDRLDGKQWQRSRVLLPSLLPVLCRPAEAQAFWGKPGGWTGQAPCCPMLSHPKMFLQSDIRDKKQMRLLAREVFLLIKGLEPHSLFLASFPLVLLPLCSSIML